VQVVWFSYDLSLFGISVKGSTMYFGIRPHFLATNLLSAMSGIARLVPALCAAVAVALSTSVSAQPTRSDVVGAQDHPLMKRFTGSWLAGYRADEFVQTFFPINAKIERDKLVEPLKVEGRVTKLHYVGPRGKSPLEVHRNYQQALTAAGFVAKYSCEGDPCAAMLFALPFEASSAKWASGEIASPDGQYRFSPSNAAAPEDVRLLSGTISKGDALLHVLVFTTAAVNKGTGAAYTYVQIAEAKAMQTGQVSIDTAAMKVGLDSEGKIALYGIFFDTGKAVLRSESKAQLDEMGKLLQGQPNLKVIVVGHTDNQGALDGNLTLSQQRAEAVVQALVQTYKVAANRMIARGIANFSPLASNAAETGRAKNRRVELVVQ
jgi:OmpA-OmpF porin, OOP family